MTHEIREVTERDKFCCFGCATANLLFGTPAVLYILNSVHIELNIWIVVILAIFMGQFAVPIAILAWILQKIFS